MQVLSRALEPYSELRGTPRHVRREGGGDGVAGVAGGPGLLEVFVLEGKALPTQEWTQAFCTVEVEQQSLSDAASRSILKNVEAMTGMSSKQGYTPGKLTPMFYALCTKPVWFGSAESCTRHGRTCPMLTFWTIHCCMRGRRTGHGKPQRAAAFQHAH